MNILLKSILGVLILLGAGFGFYIYKQGGGVKSDTNVTKSQNEVTNAAPKNVETAAGIPTLEISGCTPKPASIAVAQGSKLKLVNNDNSRREIVFDKDKFYGVEANSSSVITIAFDNVPGIYNYGCDLATTAVGNLQVSQ